MIGVANRECLGQRIVERDILALEIAHRIGAIDPISGAMRRPPLVHPADVPRLMLHRPGMAGGGQFLRIGRKTVAVERSGASSVGKECGSTCRSRWLPYL